MKLSVSLILVVLLMMGRTNAFESGRQPKEEQHRMMMVGAFSEIEEPNSHDRLPAVTSFVQTEMLAKRSSLTYSFSSKENLTIELAQAFQQVVAGMNYRLLYLAAQTETDSKSRTYVGAFTVTVYDRFGDLSVTRWGKEVPLNKALAIQKKEKEGVYELDDSDFQH